MKYEITTKQGTNYIVSDDDVWIWIEVERELGLTLNQALIKIGENSLDVITCVLYKAAKAAELTEYKTQKAWVQNEFASFEAVDDDPKAVSTTPSSE